MSTHRVVAVVLLLPLAWACEGTTPSTDRIARQRALVSSASGTAVAPASECPPPSLVASPPSHEPSGTPIVLTAAGGCATSDFRFLYKPVGAESCGPGDGCGPWLELRGWDGPTFTWDTTGLATGRYRVRAQARGEADEEWTRIIPFEFTDPCTPGYGSDGAGTCVDIDECKTGNGACDPLVPCTNTPGSRTCGPCPDGYSGSGDTACMLPFVATELIGRPTDRSITVNLMAGQGLEAYLEYGTAAGSYDGRTSPADFADGIVEIVAGGLAPDTRYYYRVRYRPLTSTAPFLAGAELTFHTQRARTAAFTFAVQSDTHQGYPSFYDDGLYRVTMANIAAAQPDFLVDLGDTVSIDADVETETTVRQKYLDQRTVFDLAAHSMPVFLALGNHENEEGWNLDDNGSDRANSRPILGANARKRFFLNPVPDAFYSGNGEPVPELDGDHLREDYYAFEWGNALFVVIDPFWYTQRKPFAGTMGGEKDDETVGNRWDWTLGDQQYQWLKQTLEQSSAPFKLVFAHQATGGTSDYVRAGARGAKYCEWGGYDVDGVTWAFDKRRPGWELPIHQLFVRANVTAFFHGHDHFFAKEVLDGVIYQEVPHAANKDYGGGFPSNPQDYAGGVLANNSGHLRIKVEPGKVTVDYVRSYLPGQGENGKLETSYEMLPCAQRDTDGDGAIDCSQVDGCPGDPDKQAAGLCGCGTADTDTDGDGSADCKDGCPQDAQKVQPGLCGCGYDDAAGCERFTVVRVGDGAGPLTLTSTAVFLEERRLDDGGLIVTTLLSTAAAAPNKPLTLSGTAPVEGTLKRSVDGRYLTLAGYAVAPGKSNVAYSSTSDVNRVVARIGADHTVDTTTAFTTSAAFNGATSVLANDRAAVSVDGSAFWVAGAGSSNTGGLWYIPLGASEGTQIVGQSGNAPGAVRTCGIFGGQLYGTNNAAPFFGVFALGSGLPTEAASAVLLSGFPTSGTSSPVDFAVLDRDSAVPGPDTVYVADDRGTGNGGGVQKWLFDGTRWALAYTMKAHVNQGARHLTVRESTSDVTLVVTTATTTNAVVKLVDTGSASAAVPLVTAGNNTAFRGVALAPLP